MSSDQGNSDRGSKPPGADGPSVVFLRFPDLSQLPPDEWFEDEEGEEAVKLEEARRQRRLSARS
ncbi:hypothetical protein [Vannielia sp. SX4]|uniref:hypothetical protein n=1 Tax=Vannielia sp. SX4 TaxID=3463852 RepID=UPI004057F336